MSACFRAADSWAANRQKAAPHRPQPMIVNQPMPPTTGTLALGDGRPPPAQVLRAGSMGS